MPSTNQRFNFKSNVKQCRMSSLALKFLLLFLSHLQEQGYSLKEQGTPRFPEIKDLLSHYSSFDLPTHDLKLTVAATYR